MIIISRLLLWSLEYSNGAGWASHSTLDMQRRAGQEESPSFLLRTRLRQLLKIPHLADRSSPLHEKPLMQTEALNNLWRPSFKGNSIANHGSKVVIVQPADRLLRPLHSDRLAVFLSATLSFSIRRIAVEYQYFAYSALDPNLLMPSHVAAPDHHDISRSGLRALPLQSLFQLIDGNPMGRNRTRRFSILMLIPRQPIHQHTPSHNSAPLTPIVNTIGNSSLSLLMRQTIVVLPSGLVRKVLQRIPLATRLRVDIDFIVHAKKVEPGLQIDRRLVELLAAEAWVFHIVQRPIQLHAFAGLDLAGGRFHNGGFEEV